MTPIDDRITAWLTQLERELATDDPALRHDAMSDAREHLVSAREELPGDAPDAEVEQLLVDYGDPVEVAESYRAADRLLHDGRVVAGPVTPPRAADDPATTTTAAEPAIEVPPARWFGVVRDSDAWAAVFYMLLALPLGIAWFTWTVTAGSVSGGLLVLIIGIPLLLAFLASIRGIALLDGRIVETLLGERMPRRSWASDGESRGLVERLKYWVTDRRTWTSIAYLLTMLPLGIAYFTVAVTLGAIGFGFITSPIVLLIAASVNDVSPEAWTWPLTLLLVPAGALTLLALLHLARGIGAIHGSYAKAMLVGGDGASRRRRPVSISGSLGHGLVFAVAALALAGVVTGAGTAISRATSSEVTRELRADGVERLELQVEGADLHFVADGSLDVGEVLVEARIRTSDDDEPSREELRIEQSGGTATVLVQCDVSVWFLDGCESDVFVRVAPDSDIELVGDTSSGDIELGAASFDSIELRSGSGEVEGRVDATDIRLETGSGDIDVQLTDAAEQVVLDTGSGEVSVEAPGAWDVSVETGSGDEDITVPRDSTTDRRMRIETGSGDVEVEPGGGAGDDDPDDDED